MPAQFSSILLTPDGKGGFMAQATMTVSEGVWNLQGQHNVDLPIPDLIQVLQGGAAIADKLTALVGKPVDPVVSK